MSLEDIERVKDILSGYGPEQSDLLPALHVLQNEYGCVNPAYYLVLAGIFNLTQAEIKGVVSFYHDFREKPYGKHILRICRAEACQSVGAAKLIHFVKELTGLSLGETSDDDSLSVEAVYCLGLCAAGPSVDLDGVPIARMDKEKMAILVESTHKEHAL